MEGRCQESGRAESRCPRSGSQVEYLEHKLRVFGGTFDPREIQFVLKFVLET
jgi:hypothetical protein